MKDILKAALRATVRGRRIRSLLTRGFSKGHTFWHALSNDRFLEIYARYQEYTRVPPESFVSNLEVIEKWAEVQGCVVECGVWRGGMSAGMADLLGPERTYYLFDSFHGLPEARAIDGKKAMDWQATDTVDNCRTEADFARQAIARSRAEHYHVIEGWFENTLGQFTPDGPIAVLRLDADWYSSTAECLNALCPLVAPGGLILIDDYFVWDGCARAIHDYLSENALPDRIQCVGSTLAYIVKSDIKPSSSIDPRRNL